ncbi:MAG: HD domain-containing protein, partial [Deltaproteobacteria bacterium]|nr:HD domain-containing protein [Deltaproteobacteria bacterium]
ILLDLMIPKFSGFEICRRIKRDPKTQFVPIIVTTPLTHQDDRLKAIQFGADDFLSSLASEELAPRIKFLLHMKFLHDDLDTSESILFSLVSALEAKDSFTKGHSERVSGLAADVGRYLSLSDREITALRKGGLLHDIGKIGVREDVLLKAEKLTDDEMNHIKTHPARGYEICAPLGSLSNCLPIIRSHHERVDGKGYPDGIEDRKIPLLAKITAVADAFDAMTHNRPYRKAMPEKQAIKIFAKEQRTGQWDPDIVQAFLDFKKF